MVALPNPGPFTEYAPTASRFKLESTASIELTHYPLPDSGGKDVFVHISAVEKAGFSNLAEGAKISYEEVPNKGKTSAENLRLG